MLLLAALLNDRVSMAGLWQADGCILGDPPGLCLQKLLPGERLASALTLRKLEGSHRPWELGKSMTDRPFAILG